MPLCRAISKPDGSVHIIHLNRRHQRPGETESQFLDREQPKDPSLVGLPFVDLDSTILPADRSQRHRWRIQGGRVQIDLTVPDPPHPRQALLNQIAAATTVDQLKIVLQTLVRA